MNDLLESFNSFERKMQRRLKWKRLFMNYGNRQVNSENLKDIPLGISSLYLESQHHASMLESRISDGDYKSKLIDNKRNKLGKIQKIKQRCTINVTGISKKNTKEGRANNTSKNKTIPKGNEKSPTLTKTITSSSDEICALPLYKSKVIGTTSRTQTFLKTLLEEIPFVENSLLFAKDTIEEISLSRNDKRLIQSYSSNFYGIENKLLRIVNFVKINNPKLTDYILAMRLTEALEQNDRYSILLPYVRKDILEISKVMKIKYFKAYIDYTLWFYEQECKL